MRYFCLWAGMLIALSAGCSGELMGPDLPPLTEREVDAPVQTDALNYRLRATSATLEFEVAVAFFNQRADTLYIERCGLEEVGFILEKRLLAAWEVAFRPICPRILGSPIVVPPNESHTATLHVRSCTLERCYPRFELEPIEGDYRLVLFVYETWEPDRLDPGPGIILAEPARVSNTFRLHRR